MIRVALVSDTHLATPGAAVAEWVADRLREADHVVHAGDVITNEALFELRLLAGGNMTAVRGNRDPSLGLPTVDTVDVDGVRFVVTHGDGFGRGDAYRRGLADLAREHDADLAVGGHTHRPLDTTFDGVRILNPGSGTGTAPAETPSVMTVDCDDGTPTVTHHVGRDR